MKILIRYPVQSQRQMFDFCGIHQRAAISMCRLLLCITPAARTHTFPVKGEG